jgi:hypothetical protein
VHHFLKKSSELVPDSCKEDGLEVNAENPKFIFISCCLDVEQNYDIKTANKSLEYEKF